MGVPSSLRMGLFHCGTSTSRPRLQFSLSVVPCFRVGEGEHLSSKAGAVAPTAKAPVHCSTQPRRCKYPGPWCLPQIQGCLPWAQDVLSWVRPLVPLAPCFSLLQDLPQSAPLLGYHLPPELWHASSLSGLPLGSKRHSCVGVLALSQAPRPKALPFQFGPLCATVC